MHYLRFGHLQKEPYKKVGDRVRKGEIFGRVGNTGNSTAPHVHFDVFASEPERPTVYSKGMSLAEVKATWIDPELYVDHEEKIPAPFSHEGWRYLQWTGNLYHTGTDINHGSAWSDEGNPLKSPVDGTVYYSHYSSGWGWMIIIKEDMPTNPNLIKQEDRPEIFFCNGKQKFHFPDWYTFDALGYKMEDVTMVPDVDEYQTSSPFPSVDPKYAELPPSPDDPRDHEPPKPKKSDKVKTWSYEYRSQIPTQMCAGFAVRNAVFALTGQRISEIMVYVIGNERYRDPGDSKMGVVLRDALKGVDHVGVFDESFCPFGDQKEEHYDKYARGLKKLTDDLKGTQFRYFRIRDEENTQYHLRHTSPIIASVDTIRGWHEGKALPDGQRRTPNHAICLIDFDGEYYTAIDSMQRSGNDTGIRRVHPSLIDERWGLKIK